MQKENIILLHGALGTQKQVVKLKNELLTHFNVFTFNFEGHGENMSKEAFSIELFTQNLEDFIQNNQLENSLVFGYSMGGYVALNYAKKHPNKLKKIITFGTKFDWTPESALKETGKLNPEKIEEKIPQFATFLEKSLAPNNWKMVMNKTAQMMLDLGNSAALQIEDLKEISTPTLITIGTLDNMVSLDESKFATSHLKNAELLELEGFVHPIEQNDLEVLAKTIVDFSH